MRQPVKYEHRVQQPRVTILGAALRAARIGKRFGLPELARRIGVNAAMISNWELGERTPSAEQVAAILGALGIVGDDRNRILALARAITPGVVIEGAQTEPRHLATLLDLEAAVTSATIWEPLIVPDLLQSPEYAAEALLALGNSPALVENLVERREIRNQIVDGPNAKPVTAYIGEHVLTKLSGSAETVGAQLRHLADVNDAASEITVRVVPFGISNHPGLASPWTFYEMPRPSDEFTRKSVVYLNHLTCGTFVHDQADYYFHAANELERIALSTAESTAALRRFAAGEASAA